MRAAVLHSFAFHAARAQERTRYFNASHAIYYDNIAALVPRAFNVYQSNLPAVFSLLSPFRVPVWLILVATLMILSAAKWAAQCSFSYIELLHLGVSAVREGMRVQSPVSVRVMLLLSAARCNARLTMAPCRRSLLSLAMLPCSGRDYTQVYY